MLDWLIRGAQVLDGTGADAFPPTLASRTEPLPRSVV